MDEKTKMEAFRPIAELMDRLRFLADEADVVVTQIRIKLDKLEVEADGRE